MDGSCAQNSQCRPSEPPADVPNILDGVRRNQEGADCLQAGNYQNALVHFQAAFDNICSLVKVRDHTRLGAAATPPAPSSTTAAGTCSGPPTKRLNESDSVPCNLDGSRSRCEHQKSKEHGQYCEHERYDNQSRSHDPVITSVQQFESSRPTLFRTVRVGPTEACSGTYKIFGNAIDVEAALAQTTLRTSEMSVTFIEFSLSKIMVDDLLLAAVIALFNLGLCYHLKAAAIADHSQPAVRITSKLLASSANKAYERALELLRGQLGNRALLESPLNRHTDRHTTNDVSSRACGRTAYARAVLCASIHLALVNNSMHTVILTSTSSCVSTKTMDEANDSIRRGAMLSKVVTNVDAAFNDRTCSRAGTQDQFVLQRPSGELRPELATNKLHLLQQPSSRSHNTSVCDQIPEPTPQRTDRSIRSIAQHLRRRRMVVMRNLVFLRRQQKLAAGAA